MGDLTTSSVSAMTATIQSYTNLAMPSLFRSSISPNAGLSVDFAQHISECNKQRPKRKQNRSCDACRESKRACDVVMTYSGSSSEAFDITNVFHERPANKPSIVAERPCTNCTRRRKRCTIDWASAQRAHKFGTSVRRKRAKLDEADLSKHYHSGVLNHANLAP